MMAGVARKPERGASAIEYSALIVLGALILGALVVIVPNPVATAVRSALCAILHTGSSCGGANARYRCTAFCPGPGHPIHPSDPLTAATKGDYVALGDSYASGEGANSAGGSYLTSKNTPYLTKGPGNSDKDGCHRSGNAFPRTVGRKYTFAGGTSSVACSGATTDDLRRGRYGEPPQIGAANHDLSRRTSTVTLSVGGDDLHFADVMRACVLDPHVNPRVLQMTVPPDPDDFRGGDRCLNQKRRIQQDMSELFRPRAEYGGLSKYQKLLSDIHRQAPNARILVVGYPHLFPEPPKKDYDTVNKADQRFLNDAARRLDSAIERQVQQMDAKAYGTGQPKMGSFEYVDNWDGLAGHELTTRHPWINGIELCPPKSLNVRHNPNCRTGLGPGTGTFHPTPDGQRAFAAAVSRQLTQGPGRTLYDP